MCSCAKQARCFVERFGKDVIIMIPPNILFRLANVPDVPKYTIPETPKHLKPLDAWVDPPYLGELRYFTDSKRCCKYTAEGWRDIS